MQKSKKPAVKKTSRTLPPATHPQPQERPRAALKPRVRDSRLPEIGTVLYKKYHGNTIEINVVENGFEYQRKTFKSISRVEAEIARHPVSGYVFFGLKK